MPLDAEQDHKGEVELPPLEVDASALDSQFQEIAPALATKDSDWLVRMQYLGFIRTVCEKHPEVPNAALVALLMPLLPGLVCQLGELRSAIVKDASLTVASIAKRLQTDFEPFVGALVPALCALAKVKKEVRTFVFV